MFTLSMSWPARDDLSEAALSGGYMWFAVSFQCVLDRRWAFMKNCGYTWFALRFCGTTRFWALSIFTYIVAHSLGMNA